MVNWDRASCLAPRLRILMLLIRLLVRAVRQRRSRGGSFVSGVLIKRMVRSFIFLVILLMSYSCPNGKLVGVAN